MQEKTANINRGIKTENVLLIGENGENLGMVLTKEALSRAYAVGMDLVEVGNKNGTPVCKIIDFGKYKYEQEKKKKKNGVQTKKQTKEIKLRPNIGKNDLVYRAKHTDEFLTEGNKVRLVVKFKGREMEHMLQTGSSLLNRFLDMVSVKYVISSNAAIEGNSISMTLSLGE